MSVGLADSTYGATAAEIIDRADSALLLAKRNGRDQLVIASRSDDAVVPPARVVTTPVEVASER